MTIKNYGFIVRGAGYKPDKHKAVLDSQSFKTTIVGVEGPQDALDVARQMKMEGIQVIELCGGFDKEWADKIMDATDNAIPVGFITFSEKSLKLLDGYCK